MGIILPNQMRGQRAFTANQTAAGTSPAAVVAEPSGGGIVPLNGAIGAFSIIPFGGGAADTTIALDMYVGRSVNGAFVFRKYLDIDATLGTATGVAGGGITDTDRIADAVTITKSSYATHIETVFERAAAAFSPGSNGIAEVVIPDLGNHEIMLFVTETAGTSANVFVTLGG